MLLPHCMQQEENLRNLELQNHMQLPVEGLVRGLVEGEEEVLEDDDLIIFKLFLMFTLLILRNNAFLYLINKKIYFSFFICYS